MISIISSGNTSRKADLSCGNTNDIKRTGTVTCTLKKRSSHRATPCGVDQVDRLVFFSSGNTNS